MLLLVRHAMPAHTPDRPAGSWDLARDGRRGAESLRTVLPSNAVLVSSPEPKARQTLEPSGPVMTDWRFREVDRDEPHGDDFRARRLAWVTGADHAGWEPRALVVARFGAAVQFWLSRAGDQPLVIASHGMAMTVWIAAQGLEDPGAFWVALRLPDVFEVDPFTRRVGRVVSTQLFQVV